MIKNRELKKHRHKILQEIEFKQAFIISKASNGYWGICGGDKTFIDFLNKLEVELAQKKPDIMALLSEAYECSVKQIKTVFFAQEVSVWPSLQPVYDACRCDKHYITNIVYIPFDHINTNTAIDNFKKYQEMGLPVLKYDEYKLAEDNPDIAFFVKPYDLIPEQYYIEEVDKVVRRCIYIPYGLEIGNEKESVYYQYQLMMQYRAWKVLCYSDQYYQRAKEYGYRNGANYLKTGHPRFDLINVDLSNNETVVDIKKHAKGRKVFMWNTHFTLEKDSGWGSYLVWGNIILDYAKKHQDIFLLWRPHPLFPKALEAVEGMNSSKVTKMFDCLLKHDNIYIDNSENYLSAFYISDAMISDATSFVPEYLAWGKPILYTPKPNSKGFSDNNITKLLYQVKSPQDIYDFFNNIKCGIDDRKSTRILNSKNHLLIQDIGTISINLIDYIAKEIVREESNANQ